MPRARSLTPEKQTQLCALVAQGAAVEQAADAVGVTLRTVQREVCRDEDFEHDLRLAELAAPVDPLKLMHQAARSHWRAAAWMLERTDQRYAKRKAHTCTADQFQDALAEVIDAAVSVASPDRQHAVSRQARAAAQRAAGRLFPAAGASDHARDARENDLDPPSLEPVALTASNTPLEPRRDPPPRGQDRATSTALARAGCKRHPPATQPIAADPALSQDKTTDLAPTEAEFDEILNRVFSGRCEGGFDLSPKMHFATQRPKPTSGSRQPPDARAA
ncbi:MAG: hypothetical protein IT424_00700 [Pirellulales bacterium]|nr:hypothetical protein [Pirellulales bacterium]